MTRFDLNTPLSPLADPVIGAIFSSVEEAGLAAKSFISAILESDNNTKLEGKLIRITPQHYHLDPISRSCRVDVEVETDANERVIFEIQTSPDASIMKRDLFSTSHIMLETSNKGDLAYQMAKKMPKVISINILTYNIRGNHTDLVQPFKILYTKAPHDVAVPNFSGYNVQLPRVLEVDPDFNSGLYCWCYTLYTAHLQGKSIQEVLAMTPELQDYTQQDNGFLQFCHRYNRAVADPQTRDEYVRWYLTIMREEGMIEAAVEAAVEVAVEEATQSVTQSVTHDIAHRMLLNNHTVEETADVTLLPLEEVMKIKTSL